MPDSPGLSSLSITGLRGVLQPIALEFNKRMTLIYGENGTGKTSICDALDLLGNGKCGSLEHISVGHGKHQHWPYLGQNASDISVQLNAPDGTEWMASVNRTQVSVTANNGKDKPTIKIWRRDQLMKLILATPGNRFEVIKPFIDISEIDQSEARLRDLLESTNGDAYTASQRVAENLQTLRGLQELTGGETGDAIAWARAQLAAQQEDAEAEIASLDAIIRQADVMLNMLGQVSGLQAAVEQAQVGLEEVKQALDTVREKVGDGQEDVLDILESAQEYFHDHTVGSSCPLCESAEKIEGLPDRINQKLAEMAEIRQATTSYENAESALNQAISRQQDAIGQIEQLAGDLLELVTQDRLSEASAALLSVTDSDTVNDVSILTTVRDAVDNRKNELVEHKGHRDGIETALTQYEENREAFLQSRALTPKVARLIEVHETERKRFVDGVLSTIADEVGRLYESIHPDEGLDKVALQLDPDRRASLNIQSEFLGQQVQPGAYFSNSHLDSLGLCILIALAKMTDPENTILVLDDILGSIDEPHVDRVVQMLYEESQYFLHTLITTNYHAWHHKIRRGQLRNADCQVIELQKWQPDVGVSFESAGRPLVDILRANITENPSEVEPIAANAGHLLEQLGDFLVTHYACSVPKRTNGNTLNEYLDGLRPKFIQHLRVEIMQSDGSYEELHLEPLISELKDIYQVRNTTGAHYNELASHLPPADVLRFGELVVQLADALICPENGFPKRERWCILDDQG